MIIRTAMRPIYAFAFSLLILTAIASCNKQQYYEGSNASLKFSADTVSFDTIFTSIGSATQRLMVYNPYDKILKISGIQLAGGNNSPFKLNIDGRVANSLSDVEVYPKDSLYIFIQIFVNPTGNALPLFIRDSIIFTTNGSVQNIKLVAYGQDVHLLKKQTLKTQTWEADKPYLLYDTIMVDTLETLTIAKGATIYLHKQSSLQIKGTLIANGDLTTPITFQGDRLEHDYNDIPGQWSGIYFLPGSTANHLDWVIIKNGTTGIQLGKYKSTFTCDLEISNSIIQNMSYYSLLAIGAKLKAVNCVFADAAAYACGLMGGNYEFYHSTLANYYGRYASRNFSSGTLNISNYYMDTTAIVNTDLMKANFYNSIIYGSNTDEILIGNKGSGILQYLFDHCLVKSEAYNNSKYVQFFTNTRWNKDPEFKFKPKMYLELDTLSAAKDFGDSLIGRLYPLDLKKIDRTLDKGPDLGAYERVE